MLFKSKIIDPKIRMDMLETNIGQAKKPKALEEAEKLAKEEKELIEKIMQADPKLLDNKFSNLDTNHVREIYYSML